MRKQKLDPIYRYSDGNTFTDYALKEDAQAAKAAQNGGTIRKIAQQPDGWTFEIATYFSAARKQTTGTAVLRNQGEYIGVAAAQAALEICAAMNATATPGKAGRP
jgi:hypothetical protein